MRPSARQACWRGGPAYSLLLPNPDPHTQPIPDVGMSWMVLHCLATGIYPTIGVYSASSGHLTNSTSRWDERDGVDSSASPRRLCHRYKAWWEVAPAGG